ncbi:MAG: hypothetical protein IKG82_09135 [Oscillospiraceae bacterium]|nr:hypothetical protein [Oscillospiraceae bacterium]
MNCSSPTEQTAPSESTRRCMTARGTAAYETGNRLVPDDRMRDKKNEWYGLEQRRRPPAQHSRF